MLTYVKTIITALSALSGLLGLTPYIRGLVQSVETPGATGEQKKTAVLSLIRESMTAIEASFPIDLPNDLVMRWANSIIDVIVAVENAIGTFTHKGEVQPAESGQ